MSAVTKDARKSAMSTPSEQDTLAVVCAAPDDLSRRLSNPAIT